MVPTVVDVVVAPSPPTGELVFAATAFDTRLPDNSKNGIYRSSDGGESWQLVHQFTCPGEPGFQNVSQIVIAPGNPNLIFAAGGCAIARSTDGGLTWFDNTSITNTTGSKVWHIAVAPREVISTPTGSRIGRRLYAAGDDHIFYTQDFGLTSWPSLRWFEDASAKIPEMASFIDPVTGTTAKFGFVGGFPDSSFGQNSSRILAVEPGRPDHLYIAAPNAGNGPAYYFRQINLGDEMNPNIVDIPDGENCLERVRCGGPAVWLGDYSGFFQNGRSGNWRRLTSPPDYFGGSTRSGRIYIVPKQTTSGYLLFVADGSHVHVSQGRPEQSASWHRLDGRDASQSKRDGDLSNRLFVHVDPHAIAVSPQFEVTLKPVTDLPEPYNQNSELDESKLRRGVIWMANDGGVYRSVDGGMHWSLTEGLSILNLQGRVAAVAPLPLIPPSLYFGVPDSDNFFSLDGGQTWRDHPRGCGDCNPWFSDPRQPSRVLDIEGPDRGNIAIDLSNPLFPDGTRSISVPFPSGLVYGSPAPGENPGVPTTKQGYRPLIFTMEGEDPLPDGDYIFIRQISNTKRVLLRTTKISQIQKPEDWDTIPEQQGPDLAGDLSSVYVVQAAGGHRSPVFYVGDPGFSNGLWKWCAGECSNGLARADHWQRIVPAADGSATVARRFFANPYNPDEIYIIDQDTIRRSIDGGMHWIEDVNLDRLVTEQKSFSYDVRSLPVCIGESAIINDMTFDPAEPGTRFAVGNAGVFYSLDSVHWERLLSTTALAGYPIGAYFDQAARLPANLSRALYVAFNGRGLLRISSIPQAAADLAFVGITTSPGPVVVGQPVTYNVEFVNNGPSTAHNIVITVRLPAGVTFVSAAGCSEARGTVTCSSGPGGIGSGTHFSTPPIVVIPTIAGTITNTASASSTNTDLNPNNNSGSITTRVFANAADVAVISLNASPAPVKIRTPLRFVPTFVNNGPGIVTDLVFTVTLPTQVTFASAGPGCSFSEAQRQVTCPLFGALQPGTNVGGLEIVVIPNVVGRITTNVRATTSVSDPNLRNNVGTAVTNVVQ
jgi:uncharacterized repeat protein (TIGR01451 family)